MKDITVIIPIVELDDKGVSLLKRAAGSVRGQAEKVVVIGSEKAIEIVKDAVEGVDFYVNNGDTSYSAQVNLAVKNCDTKYFSVLEYDDAFSDIWFKNLEAYMSTDGEDVFAYLPLTEVIDEPSGDIIGYANEAFWASAFGERLGFLTDQDITAFSNYFGFNVSGGAFKKDDFLSIGGLKESIKLVFWYEFIHRALYRQKSIYVVPKVGCFHYANRPGSLSDTYAHSMSEKEADWWVELARKEYFFPHDRKKTYEE